MEGITGTTLIAILGGLASLITILGGALVYIAKGMMSELKDTRTSMLAELTTTRENAELIWRESSQRFLSKLEQLDDHNHITADEGKKQTLLLKKILRATRNGEHRNGDGTATP